jgi:hypothetical protein
MTPTMTNPTTLALLIVLLLSADPAVAQQINPGSVQESSSRIHSG